MTAGRAPTTPEVPLTERLRGRFDIHSPEHGPIAQFLLAWAPLSLILVGYGIAAWLNAPLAHGGADTNRVGARLHIAELARWDESMFGVLPTIWLQERLLQPTAQWYDAAAALVYATHFVAIPALTAYVWFRLRRRFTFWLYALFTMSAVGMICYVAYPAAPPWLAADEGQVGAVARTSTLGWDYLGLGAVRHLLQFSADSSNPVAAMPSLHAGAAMLVAMFLWPSVSWWGRVVCLAYAVAMGFVLVYTGEHYVVDVVAGWLVAALAIGVASLLERRRRARSDGSSGVDRTAGGP